jgi:DNA-binding SARP family transcriptional activator
VPQPTLEIRLLGALELVRDGRPVALPASKRSRALLGYLVATDRSHPRAHLCDLLWDGPDDPRAALRWSLTKLRPLVAEADLPRLVSTGDRVAFEAQGVAVDLATVRREVAAGVATLPLEELVRAAELFRGEFLEGLDLPGCYRYHEWWVAEREAARALRLAVLDALVERRREKPEEALPDARKRVAIDPLSDQAHAEVVRLLVELGRPKEALDQYESARRILEAELGQRPSAALESARKAIGRPAGVLPSPPPMRPVAGAQPPLVGRERERAVLDALAQRSGEGKEPRVLLIVGEPGIGKSRLLDELGALVRRLGGLVLCGRAFEAEMVRPYGAWIDALRSVPLGHAMDHLREDLAPLLPELGVAKAEEGDRARLFDAVVQLLSRLAGDAPVAVLLDDVHWFDEASAALLHYAARALHPSRVILAAAARPGELADNPAARRLVRALGREGFLEKLAPRPLDARETAALARSLVPAIDVERVFVESQGNPLFALEVTRALERGDSAFSDSLEGLIEDRIACLDEAGRELVAWAAALGHGFSPRTLEALTGMPIAELMGALEALERHRVLKVCPQGGDEGGYDFVHDLIRRAAYSHLSEPRRRLVHAQIARVLDARGGDGADAGDVAHHAALGGDDERATRACLAAGKRCMRIFAYAEAAALAERGIRHARRLRQETGLPIQMELLKVYVHSGAGRRRVQELEGELSRVITSCQEAGLHAQVQTGFYLSSFLHYHDGAYALAREDTLRAAEAGRAADPATAARALANTGRCLIALGRDFDHAEALLVEARTAAGGACLEILDLHWGMGVLRYHDGDHERAEVDLRHATELARARGDHWSECECLSYLARIALEGGRPQDTLALCQELVPVAAKMGDGSEAPFAAALAALARGAEGEPGAADELEGALAALRDADSKARLAYILNAAAEIDVRSARPSAARKKAEEALVAADAVGQRSERALARSLLAGLALAAGDRGGALGHLGAVHGDLEAPRALSRRARAALAAIESRLGPPIGGGPPGAESPFASSE